MIIFIFYSYSSNILACFSPFVKCYQGFIKYVLCIFLLLYCANFEHLVCFSDFQSTLFNHFVKHFLRINFFHYEFFPFTEFFRNIYVRVSIFYRCIAVMYIFFLCLDFKHICYKLSTREILMCVLSTIFSYTW